MIKVASFFTTYGYRPKGFIGAYFEVNDDVHELLEILSKRSSVDRDWVISDRVVPSWGPDGSILDFI